MADRSPISEAHVKLGEELRRVRKAAKKTVNDVGTFSGGHVSNVERGHSATSRDFVDIYIKEFGGSASLILPLFQATKDAATELRQTAHVDASGLSDIKLPETDDELKSEVRGSFFVPNRDAYYIFNERGALQQVRYVYTLKARKEGAWLMFAGHYYINDRRPGVLKLEPSSGCDIYHLSESSIGAITAYLKLPKPLSLDDDARTVSYVLYAHTQAAAYPMVGFAAPATEAGRCAIHVQFTPPALPERIWWYQEESLVLAQQEPSSVKIFEAPTDNYYFKEFYSPPKGFQNGIAWLWPSAILER